MEMVHVALRKQTLRNWKAQDWVEHASFGVGQVSVSREDKLDIEFVSGGRKTILKSTELKSAAPPSPDLTISREKRKPHTKRAKMQSPPKVVSAGLSA
jgi:transcription elongation factor GreA-like protein